MGGNGVIPGEGRKKKIKETGWQDFSWKTLEEQALGWSIRQGIWDNEAGKIGTPDFSKQF